MIFKNLKCEKLAIISYFTDILAVFFMVCQASSTTIFVSKKVEMAKNILNRKFLLLAYLLLLPHFDFYK